MDIPCGRRSRYGNARASRCTPGPGGGSKTDRCAPRSDRVGTCPPDAIRADIVQLRRSVGRVHYREVAIARLAHQLTVRKNFPTSRSSMSSVDRTPLDLEAYETRARLGPCFVCALLKGDPDYRNESVYENADHGALVRRWRRARFRRLCTGPAAAVVDPRGPLRDRRALHVVRHREQADDTNGSFSCARDGAKLSNARPMGNRAHHSVGAAGLPLYSPTEATD